MIGRMIFDEGGMFIRGGFPVVDADDRIRIDVLVRHNLGPFVSLRLLSEELRAYYQGKFVAIDTGEVEPDGRPVTVHGYVAWQADLTRDGWGNPIEDSRVIEVRLVSEQEDAYAVPVHPSGLRKDWETAR